MSQYSENKFYESDNHSWGIIFQYVQDKSLVLDVGCSSGTLGQVLKERKHCVVDGIEPFHEDAVEAASKLRNVYEVNVETGDLSLLKHKYDVIIFADVLEHLVDPELTLKKMKKYLKTDGVILYSIPNMAHISIRLSLLEGNFDHTETGLIDKTHLHFYTNQQIKRMFENAGYTITDQKYTYIHYPKTYIGKRLKELGLAPVSDTIINKLTDDIESQAFQFVGAVKPSSTTIKHKSITALPHTADSNQLNAYIENLQNNMTALGMANKKLDETIAIKQNEIDILQSQSARLGHRAVQKAYRLIDNRRKRSS